MAPLKLAVSVAALLCATALVVTLAPPAEAPAGIEIVEGTLATAELLDRFTTAPPAGARPFNSTVTLAFGEPPVMLSGAARSSFSVRGSTVNWPEAETPFSVAVIVTGVALLTWPIETSTPALPRMAGTVSVAGTGTRPGFELLRATMAPPAGAAALSCTPIAEGKPLYTCCSETPRSATDTGVAGAAPIVNVPLADGAVTADVVAEALP